MRAMDTNAPQMDFTAWLAAVAAQLGPSAQHIASCILEERGDEPRDMWAAGDSPVEYATFLTAEYTAFGPEGE